MKVVRKNALVPYSAQQMYDLVMDIEHYPEFLPWCVGASIISEFANGLEARLDVSKGKFQKSFSTRNQYIKNREIKMMLVEGPFSYLQGAWHFDAIGEAGCRVSLDLEFDFDSVLLSSTIGPVFTLITDRMLDAFIAEADNQYG